VLEKNTTESKQCPS